MSVSKRTVYVTGEIRRRFRGFSKIRAKFVRFTERETHQKVTGGSKASGAPHQSLNRKRSRLVCRPIWRTSTLLLGSSRPPPLASTNHDSIFDLAKISSPAASKDGHRHGGGGCPRTPEGGKTEQTAWTVAGARKIFAERETRSCVTLG